MLMMIRDEEDEALSFHVCKRLYREIEFRKLANEKDMRSVFHVKLLS